jgi:uncharacterized protein
MEIPILHLEDGDHRIEGVIKAGSLQFYQSDSYPNDISVSAKINKFGSNISCQINVKTSAHFNCDRCLSEFDRQINERFELLFYLGPKKLETDEEDIIHLSPEVKEIDIDPHIQEVLILALPMKQLCSENCRGICAGCGIDLNTDRCECKEKPVDSRWEKLLKIKNQKS